MSTVRPTTQPVTMARRPARATAGVRVASHVHVRPRTSTPTPAVPGVGRTWAMLLEGLVSGRPVVLPGPFPPYARLAPEALAEAVRRGGDRRVEQGFLSSDRAGTKRHEPVNFVVRGTREQLTSALTSQGWVEANPRNVWSYIKVGLSVLFHTGHEAPAPVSEQFLDGRSETMAFNKASHYNLSRDHMRVYHQGQDPHTGEDLWAIAATRDTALELHWPHPERQGFWPWQWKWHAPSFGHQVDAAIDGERDLIMHDLLASGRVRDWAAVTGDRPAGLAGTPLGDGQLQVHHYRTDGRVYEVALK